MSAAETKVVPLYRKTTLDTVLALAHEYPVFPCRVKAEVVNGISYPAKSPLIAKGFKSAKSANGALTKWWTRWPDALVGVPTGTRTGIVVVDIDPEGVAWYDKHRDQLPVTQVNRTHRGLHLLFRDPLTDSISSTHDKFEPGVDVRGDGGYVIWWPAHGCPVENEGIFAELPDWLLDLIKQPDPDPANDDDVLLEKRKTSHTIAQAALIVNQLDADMAHDQWRNIGMGLHHQFDGHEHAFQIWDEWSALAKKDGNYPGTPAMQNRWRSFRKDSQRGAVSFRTILGVANDVKESQPTAIDFSILAGRTPPARLWWHGQWLTNGPTLCSGSGGVGKSLLLQALLTALANGKDYLGTGSQCEPLRVLGWFCEDDHDELWRRQIAINNYFGLPLDGAGERLCLVPRPGFDNTLISLNHQRPAMVPALTKYLTEQVNDLRIDVLLLDNLAQTFGASEIDRHHTTMFINAIYGMVKGRPFAPIFAGHTARAQGSEFSGSAAWENACRMRWYLGYRVPGRKAEEGDNAENSDIRWLARRKVNYAAKDILQFRFEQGLFVPQDAWVAEFDATSQLEKAERIVLDGIAKLIAVGIVPSDVKQSGGYLPRQLVDKNWSEGFKKQDLERAMNSLIGKGTIRRDGKAGKGSDRHWKAGLVVAQDVTGKASSPPSRALSSALSLD
ncbi:MAG TPA: bifunctional DNA primase/polymerase [Steroidobacteraceae bacterium]|jgi:hypothetical protein